MFFYHLMVSLGVWVFMVSDAMAGAWNLSAQSGQIISTTLYDTASKAYDNDGDLIGGVAFEKTESQIFWEHGLTQRLTWISQAGLQNVNYTALDGQTQVNGLADTKVGVRAEIFRSPQWVLSVQPSFIIAGEGENIPDADLGNGGNNIELRALVGRSFTIADKPGFLDVQTAVNLRSNQEPNQWRIDASAGIRAIDPILVIGQVFYADNGGRFDNRDIILPNRSLKLQGSFVYQWSEKTSLQLGAFQTVAGKNIVREQAVFAAIWRRY